MLNPSFFELDYVLSLTHVGIIIYQTQRVNSLKLNYILSLNDCEFSKVSNPIFFKLSYVINLDV